MLSVETEANAGLVIDFRKVQAANISNPIANAGYIKVQLYD